MFVYLVFGCEDVSGCVVSVFFVSQCHVSGCVVSGYVVSGFNGGVDWCGVGCYRIISFRLCVV